MAKSFSQDHMNQSHTGKGVYDREQTADNLQAVVDAVRSGAIDLITRRVMPDGVFAEASDGTGRKASYAFLEWAHNK